MNSLVTDLMMALAVASNMIFIWLAVVSIGLATVAVLIVTTCWILGLLSYKGYAVLCSSDFSSAIYERFAELINRNCSALIAAIGIGLIVGRKVV